MCSAAAGKMQVLASALNSAALPASEGANSKRSTALPKWIAIRAKNRAENFAAKRRLTTGPKNMKRRQSVINAQRTDLFVNLMS